MELQELYKHREELEARIHELLVNFHIATGVAPFVEVEWTSCSTIESSSRIFKSPIVKVSMTL